jgi:predicted lipid-binding transport protein (Tim44 family)
MTMKKWLVGLMLALLTITMLTEAQARKMGGGSSFGRQSTNVTRQAQAPAPAAVPRSAAVPAAGTAAAAAKPASPWKNILGGALLGLGIGALLSHLGLGGALGSLLMVALLALAGFFVYRMIRTRNGSAPLASGFEHMPQSAGNTPEIGSRLQPQAFEVAPPSLDKVAPPSLDKAAPLSLDKAAPLSLDKAAPMPATEVAPAPPAAAQWGVPADFDEAAFLRHAKSNFIRLQAAWDQADANDIREFTTPEVFAELKIQIAERGAAPEFTDVVTIDAELLGIETSASDYLASVKFKGMIKPAQDALAEPFSEVWNMSKPLSGNSGWVLAGIQQIP